jgi:hypothetical protein
MPLPNRGWLDIVAQYGRAISGCDAALAAATRKRRDPMNTRKILIGSGVAAAVLTGAVVAGSTIWPNAPSYAAGAVARQVGFGSHGGWHRGEGRGHGRGMAMICSDRRDERLENVLAFVEGFVSLTPEQTEAWHELTGTVRAGSAIIGEKCTQLEEAGTPQSAPDKLARVESMASTGLAVLQRILPAFEGFYTTLSDKQKKALDDMIAHRGQRS